MAYNPFTRTPEQERYRIERVKAARRREWASRWPDERSAYARKMVKARHAKEIALYGKIQRPYIPLQMHKKDKKEPKGDKNGL
jgi:hypothetical protein